MLLRLLAILTALFVTGALAAADKPTPDLAMVPGDAVAFVHVKFADVWKSDAFKNTRASLEKAGPKAFAAIDEQFVPAPSSIDRGTLVVLPPKEGDGGLTLAGILAFNKPYDAAAVRKANMPKAVEKKAGEKVYFTEEALDIAIHFADDHTLVVSTPEGMPKFLAAGVKADGPMASAVKQAAGQQITAAILNPKHLPLPPDLMKALDDKTQALMKAERVTLAMTFTTELSLAFAADYPTADDAKAAEKVARGLAQDARKGLDPKRAEAEQTVFGKDGKGKQVRSLLELPGAVNGLSTLAWWNWMDEVLADPPLKAAGNSLTLKFTTTEWTAQTVGMGLTYLFPIIQGYRQAAGQAGGDTPK